MNAIRRKYLMIRILKSKQIDWINEFINNIRVLSLMRAWGLSITAMCFIVLLFENLNILKATQQQQQWKPKKSYAAHKDIFL